MIAFSGLNTVLAWLFLGILGAVLGWLLRRARRDDTLSSITRPDREEPPAGTTSRDGS